MTKKKSTLLDSLSKRAGTNASPSRTPRVKLNMDELLTSGVPSEVNDDQVQLESGARTVTSAMDSNVPVRHVAKVEDFLTLPQVRSHITAEAIEERAASIAANDQLSPIVVYRERHNGKFVIYDGETRYRAIQKLVEDGNYPNEVWYIFATYKVGEGIEYRELTEEVIRWHEDSDTAPADVIERFIGQANHNDQHNPLSFWDRLRIVSLIESSGYDAATAYKKLNWDKSAYSRLAKIAKAPERLINFFKENSITDAHVASSIVSLIETHGDMAERILTTEFNRQIGRSMVDTYKQRVEQVVIASLSAGASNSGQSDKTLKSNIVETKLPDAPVKPQQSQRTPIIPTIRPVSDLAPLGYGRDVVGSIDINSLINMQAAVFKSLISETQHEGYVPVFFIDINAPEQGVVWEIHPQKSSASNQLIGITEYEGELVEEVFDWGSCRIVAVGERNEH